MNEEHFIYFLEQIIEEIRLGITCLNSHKLDTIRDTVRSFSGDTVTLSTTDTITFEVTRYGKSHLTKDE